MLERANTSVSIAVSDSKKNLIPFCFVQLLFVAAGITSIMWAFFGSQFRDGEGSLTATFCLPITVGMGLIGFGCALASAWKRPAFWFVLALGGQAVALQMIAAGPLIHYQHYKPLGDIGQRHPLLLIYFALQTALVSAGMRTRWASIQAWLRRNFKGWQLAGMCIFFGLTSAAMSREAPFYIAELIFATFVQAINLGNVVLMVWAIPEKAVAGLTQGLERFVTQGGVEVGGSVIQNPNPVLSPSSLLRINSVEGSKIANPTEEPSGIDRVPAVGAIWVIILAAVLNFVVYERHPHVPDEVMYLYHARYLANWSLAAPAPPVPEAFSLYMIPHRSENWYSIFPPGWPAILALGVLFGAAWLVNPLLAGLNVLLTYMFIQRIYNRRAARISVLLLCVSPWHVFMAMNFMAHTSTMTFALLAALAATRGKSGNKTMWSWAGGLAAGVVSLIRPLDGLIVASLLGIWSLVGPGRLRISSFAAFVVGLLMTGASIFPYNWVLTGNPTIFPLTAYYEEYFGPKANALGFGPERGLGWALDAFPGHSPTEALINATLNIFSVNIELFGWATGSLILVALLLFSGSMQRADYLMVAVLIVTCCLYSLYWFHGGPDFGARYWYLMLVPLIAMTGSGLQALEKTFPLESGVLDHSRARLTIALMSLCLLAMINYLPWRALDKYHRYLGMRPDIIELASGHSFGTSLVLIRGSEHPDYASAWVYNPLNPYAAGPVYAWDRNPEVRAQLLRAYSDRPIWLVDGPSITDKGFRIIAGPLSVSELKKKQSGCATEPSTLC
jgi:Dolichyl-phosphate-mannose-protein mannosyltransferase